jgi:hypothetical protein
LFRLKIHILTCISRVTYKTVFFSVLFFFSLASLKGRCAKNEFSKTGELQNPPDTFPRGPRDTTRVYLTAAYKASQNKYIRAIYIFTFDPVGYDFGNDQYKSESFIEKAVNDLHHTTRPQVIKNLIMIKENQKFDSSLVKESERLISQAIFVHDVVLIPEPVPGVDSVDIYIRELDSWTLIPDGAISTSSFSAGGVENDFLGWGHSLQGNYSNNYNGGQGDFSVNYFIPNIKNTYISADLQFAANRSGSYNKQIDLERPFYSPYARWAGGIYLAQANALDSISLIEPGIVRTDYKYNLQDYWLGRAWPISKIVRKDSTEYERTTNFTLAARYYNINYYQRPASSLDSINKFSNDISYLASAGISTRVFVKERYIYKYGIIEYVPVGRIFQVTTGYDIRNGLRQWYTGARASWGNYYKIGYLSPDIEYGNFIYGSSITQETVSMNINYFTKLFRWGKWKFRQFIIPQIILGINRLPYETASIDESLGLEGYTSTFLQGSNEALLNWRTQAYAPWHFLGFDFGPYFIANIAMVGQSRNGFIESKLYTQFGIGFLINNRFLVANNFQIALGFFPFTTGKGLNAFTINPFATTEYTFNDFQTVKPIIVPYQ